MAKYIVPVQHGMMMESEKFLSEDGDYSVGDVLIIRGERGVDYGTVDGPVQEVDRDIKGLGEVMRRASSDDMRIIQHIREVREPEELAYCKECIQERKLPMKLAGLEHLFGGDKVIFYFLADGRVDFRELVKDLARRYRMRIEMRQIGVRDEARMLSDYEHCGRELCCRTFLRKLDPVTMRMAKMQKTTLDPSKISGHCGRLMCCLRFEDEVYTLNRNELPKKGEVVATEQHEGIVISTNILTQYIVIGKRDGTTETIHLSEVIDRKGRSQQNQSCCKSSDKPCRNQQRDNRGNQQNRQGQNGESQNRKNESAQENSSASSAENRQAGSEQAETKTPENNDRKNEAAGSSQDASGQQADTDNRQ